MMKRDYVVVENTHPHVKIILNSLNYLFHYELFIMVVRKGLIQGELGEFLELSLNLIKLDNGLRYKIRKIDIFRKKTSGTI